MRNRQRGIAAITLIVTAVGVAACTDANQSTTTEPVADPQAIVGTWLLESITAAGELYPIPVDHPRTEDFPAPAAFEFTDDNFLNGWGVCNDFRIEYQFDGRLLTLQNRYFTLLLCSETEGLMEAEDLIFGLLMRDQVAVAFSGPDAQVLELSGGEVLLTLRRAT